MKLFGFGKKKEITTDEAIQKISALVNARDFEKLQTKLRGKQSDAYRIALKNWAIEHEDPEVNKVGRKL